MSREIVHQQNNERSHYLAGTVTNYCNIVHFCTTIRDNVRPDYLPQIASYLHYKHSAVVRFANHKLHPLATIFIYNYWPSGL